jgi:tetratricopeptide (TPR) repeat protein
MALGTNPLCGGENLPECERLVNEQIEAIQRLEPKTPAAPMVRAQFLMSTGRALEAEAMLRKACQSFTSQDFGSCQRRRVQAAAVARSRELLDAASRDLAGGGCGTVKACGELYSFLGAQAEGLGDHLRALGYYKRAAAEEPTDVRWAAIARTATAVGDHAAATGALTRLRQSRPNDQAVERRLDAERRRVLLSSPR